MRCQPCSSRPVVFNEENENSDTDVLLGLSRETSRFRGSNHGKKTFSEKVVREHETNSASGPGELPARRRFLLEIKHISRFATKMQADSTFLVMRYNETRIIMTNFKKGWFYNTWKIAPLEFGLHFIDGEFVEILKPGKHKISACDGKEHNIEIVSHAEPVFAHSKLDEIVLSGKLEEFADIVEIGDTERALVYIDGRFTRILGGGRHVHWKEPKKVRIEIVDASTIRFEHPSLGMILSHYVPNLDRKVVSPGCIGLLYYDEHFIETLPPGSYAFWIGMGSVKIDIFSELEQMVEIAAQELMSADKVTLRLNAAFGYRITDARKMSQTVVNIEQYLYREAQLALRSVIGTRELDQFLGDREELGIEAERLLKDRAEAVGVVITSFGIRDVILPGEMKEMLNKVTAAKKAAEANLIIRREETAAMRSQANTAKLLENNPTLMRLRELEVLEKIAGTSNLKVILGEKGLTEQVVNLL